MKDIGGILYVEWAEAERAGISYNTIELANRRGSSTFPGIIADPTDARKRLIPYERMADKYKHIIDIRLCNGVTAPEWFKRQMTHESKIAAMEALKRAAKSTINSEEYNQLAILYGDKKGYALAFICSIIRLTLNISGKKEAQNYHCGSKEVLIQVCMELINNEHPDYAYKNIMYFRRKIKAYEDEGVQCMISNKLGKSNAQKMDEKQLILFAKLWTDGRKFSMAEIHRLYEEYCKEQGWKAVSRQNLINLANGKLRLSKDFNNICSEIRYGKKYNLDTLQLVISRNKPKHPDSLWIIDGTPIELYYKDAHELKRMGFVWVIDANSWKILGYSIRSGKGENADQIYEAVKMAISRTGRLPYQLQYDNGSGLKAGSTQEWFKRISKYATPTEVGRARAKVIETMIGNFNRKILKFYPNHSGGNITAKNIDTSVNPDYIKEHAKHFPDKAGVIEQIHEAVALWNNVNIRKWKASPNEMYATPYEEVRALTFEDSINLFWKWRKRGDTYLTYKYTYKGITIQYSEDTEPVDYIVGTTANEIADFMLSARDKKFWVKFDPDNLETIAIYEPADDECNAKLIAYANEKEKASMDLHTATDKEREAYIKMRTAQKLQIKMAKERSDAILNSAEAEEILKSPITAQSRYKEAYNNAEEEMKRLQIGGYIDSVIKRSNPMQSNIDNIYSDGEEGGVVE